MRFGWSGNVPLAIPAIATILYILGYGIFHYAMSSNRFFDTVVVDIDFVSLTSVTSPASSLTSVPPEPPSENVLSNLRELPNLQPQGTPKPPSSEAISFTVVNDNMFKTKPQYSEN